MDFNPVAMSLPDRAALEQPPSRTYFFRVVFCLNTLEQKPMKPPNVLFASFDVILKRVHAFLGDGLPRAFRVGRIKGQSQRLKKNSQVFHQPDGFGKTHLSFRQ